MAVSSSINWVQHGEQITGQGDPNDVLNRPVRDIVSKSGYAPDGSDFAGFIRRTEFTSGSISGSVTGSLTYATGSFTGSVGILTGSVLNFATNYSGSGYFKAIDAYNVGAKGDGTANDSSSLGSGSIAASPVRQAIHLSPGIYVISGSGIVTSSIQFQPGAILRISSGSNITFLKSILAGTHQIFDLSYGGTVSFTNNGHIDYYRPQWFGVKGDSVTNDSPALNLMFQCIPDNSIVKFSNGFKMALGSTVYLWNRVGISMGHDIKGFLNAPSSQIAQFIWNGPPGGIMMAWYGCGFMHMKGMHLIGVSASIGLDMDEPSGATRICTENTIEQCFFQNGKDSYRNPNWVGIRNAATSSGNCEYHVIDHNNFQGSNITARFGTSVQMVSGSPWVYIGDNTFSATDIGNRFRIANPSGVSGSGMDVRIANVLTSATASLTATASFTVNNNSYYIIDEGFGIGFQNAGGANAKRMIVRNNDFYSLDVGIDCKGGSLHAHDNFFEDSECNISLGGTQITEPSYDIGSNTETSRQHLRYNGHNALTIMGGRFEMIETTPNGAYFELAQDPNIASITFIGNDFGAWPGNGYPNLAYVFGTAGKIGASKQLTLNLIGNEFGQRTWAQMGLGADILGSRALRMVAMGNDGGGISEVDNQQFVVMAGTGSENVRMQRLDGFVMTGTPAKFAFDSQFLPTYLPTGSMVTMLDESSKQLFLNVKTSTGAIWTGSISVGG